MVSVSPFVVEEKKLIKTTAYFRKVGSCPQKPHGQGWSCLGDFFSGLHALAVNRIAVAAPTNPTFQEPPGQNLRAYFGQSIVGYLFTLAFTLMSQGFFIYQGQSRRGIKTGCPKEVLTRKSYP